MPHRLRSRAVVSVVAAGAVALSLAGSWPLPTPTKASSQSKTSALLRAAGLSAVLGSDGSMGSIPRGKISGVRPSTLKVRSGSSACGSGPVYPLTTSGSWIVSDNNPNCRVRLAGVTWYGFQSTNFVLAGLDFENYQTILNSIAELGFNSVRIPLSDQLVKYNNKIKINVKKWMKAEPKSFRTAFVKSGAHPLTLLDDIIAQAKAHDLMVILDNHFSKARNATDVANHAITRRASRGDGIRGASIAAMHCWTTTGCPLWYGDGYSQKQWIQDWKTLTYRYLSDSNVIGFDLRNEPHTNWLGPSWNLPTYLTAGATWGPCGKALCGKYYKLSTPATDWAAAATLAGNTILAINPHLLMFVEGTQLYPQLHTKHGVEPYWWGSILKGVATDPIQFKVPHQLVYSPHEWGPWKCCGDEAVSEFSKKTTEASLWKVFDANWGFILNSSNPKVQAPIWLGEFNTCNAPQRKSHAGKIRTPDGCIQGTTPGSEGQWFQALIDYLKAYPQIGWSYYPLNATNVLNQQSNNSVLGCPWKTNRKKCNPWRQVRIPDLMKYLTSIETQPN